MILPLKLEWEPCYSVPADMVVVKGDRVRVPFSGREYVGVVSAVYIEPSTNPSKIKEIISVVNDLGHISFEELEFWRELAGYYLCTVGEVYKAAYPSGKVSLEEARARALAKAAEREAVAREKEKARVEKRKIVLENRLVMRREALCRAKKDAVKVRLQNEIASMELELSVLSRETEEQNGVVPARETEVCSSEAVVPGTGWTASSADADFVKIILSSVQEKAYKSIKECFSDDKVVLLDGVTGSGKTEVYLKLAVETIARGGNILYMVPEIALSRQLEDRLRNVFGDRLLVFHSGESLVHRREVASKVRDRNYVVLGTRSSIFLPHHDLGLVIVDEEHDGSYKQESPAPRYNARDAAIMLANINKKAKGKCNVLLGSATPSLESLYNCVSGKFAKVDLKEKYYGADTAEIEIIDTCAERRKRGMTGMFSRKLIEHIAGTLSAGRQVIVLRARRSYSPAVQCPECGFIPKCPYCNVSLSYHKVNGRLVCHYCGHAVPFMPDCPKCGSVMKGIGAGTQKVEEELAGLFPDAKVARLDSDAAQSKAYENRVIKEFADKEIDILVGTQIVTKGFDFPYLSLVVVLQADTLVGMQDFRADEKAVQLLEQFRGRCGRRNSKGLLVIQTAQPEHPVYQRMKSGECGFFSNELLLERKTFGYPPFARLVNIILHDNVDERAERMADSLASVLNRKFEGVTGPFVPGSGMSEGSHIRMLRVCFKRDRSLVEKKSQLKKAIADFEVLSRYPDHIIIDVDPL